MDGFTISRISICVPISSKRTARFPPFRLFLPRLSFPSETTSSLPLRNRQHFRRGRFVLAGVAIRIQHIIRDVSLVPQIEYRTRASASSGSGALRDGPHAPRDTMQSMVPCSPSYATRTTWHADESVSLRGESRGKSVSNVLTASVRCGRS